MAEITRSSTAKKFIKAHTKLRVGSDAIEAMVQGLNNLSAEAIKRAVRLAKTEDRTTLLARDIETALRASGGVDATPEGIFAVVEKMTPEDVGQIALLIADWVKQNRE